MKIDKLTPEQEALMTVVRDEWINFCLGGDTSIDKDKCIQGIEWIYSLAKLKRPKFIAFAEGPMAAQIILNIFPNCLKAVGINKTSVWNSVGNSVRNSVWNSVENSVRNSVRNSVENSVGNSVRNSVRNSVWNSVENSVWNSVRNSVENSVRNSVRNSVWNSVENSVRNSVRNSVENSVRNSVENSVWNSVWNSVGTSVENSVGNSVENSVRNSVQNSVENSVWKINFEYPYCGIGWWAGWFSFYDYFEKQGISTDEFRKFREWGKTGVWESLWFEDLCVIICRPSGIKKNKAGQLHCISGPAAKWPSGEVYWFLNGIQVNEQIVMHPEKLTKKEILGEKNVDVRREMLRQIGMERFCALTNPKVIDKQGDYELLSIDLSDTLKGCTYLKMKNPSIGIWHVEGCEGKTVQEALNWRAGNIKKDWKPIQLT